MQMMYHTVIIRNLNAGYTLLLCIFWAGLDNLREFLFPPALGAVHTFSFQVHEAWGFFPDKYFRKKGLCFVGLTHI